MNFQFEFLAAILAIWIAYVLQPKYARSPVIMICIIAITSTLTLLIKLSLSNKYSGTKILGYIAALGISLWFPYVILYDIGRNCYGIEDILLIKFSLPIIVFFWIINGEIENLFEKHHNQEALIFNEKFFNAGEFD
jgi:hypothetical protein